MQPVVALAAPLLVAVICWIYLATGAGMGMDIWAMTTLQFPPPSNLLPPNLSIMKIGWSPQYFATSVFMWWTMMLAMMLPGAMLPIARAKPLKVYPAIQFLAGYAPVWFGFSVGATILQYGFEKAGWLDAMKLWSTSDGFSFTLLIAAALYQFSSVKTVAIQYCRGTPPTDSLQSEGFRHSINCLSATAPMMGLLFVGGVMNIYWMLGLTMIVLVEKTVNNRAAPRIIGGTFSLMALFVLIAE